MAALDLGDLRGAGNAVAEEARSALGPQRDRDEWRDVADADRDMAGIASKQADVVAANIRALIAGTGELTSWDSCPTP